MPPRPNDLPAYSWRTFHPQAALHYITDEDLADVQLASLKGPVGFDLEWKPNHQKGGHENPVAVVQLANQETVLVIQISSMLSFPNKLREFLENPDSPKAGVAIQNDVLKLYRDWCVPVRNCVDLSLLARCADNAQWKGKYTSPLGLSRLVEAYESLYLQKGKITRSNWELQLSTSQIEYAGNDAHAAFVLYQRLIAMAQAMKKIPRTTYYSFDAIQGRLCEPSGRYWNCHNPDYDPGPPPPPKQSISLPALDAAEADTDASHSKRLGQARNRYLTFRDRATGDQSKRFLYRRRLDPTQTAVAQPPSAAMQGYQTGSVSQKLQDPGASHPA